MAAPTACGVSNVANKDVMLRYNNLPPLRSVHVALLYFGWVNQNIIQSRIWVCFMVYSFGTWVCYALGIAWADTVYEHVVCIIYNIWWLTNLTAHQATPKHIGIFITWHILKPLSGGPSRYGASPCIQKFLSDTSRSNTVVSDSYHLHHDNLGQHHQS